jgi:hypothetical protein
MKSRGRVLHFKFEAAGLEVVVSVARSYIGFYKSRCPHSFLDGKTPDEAYSTCRCPQRPPHSRSENHLRPAHGCSNNSTTSECMKMIEL